MELRGQQPCLSCSTPCSSFFPPKKPISFCFNSLLSFTLLLPLVGGTLIFLFFSSGSRWSRWAFPMISCLLFSYDRRGMSGILNSHSFCDFMQTKRIFSHYMFTSMFRMELRFCILPMYSYVHYTMYICSDCPGFFAGWRQVDWGEHREGGRGRGKEEEWQEGEEEERFITNETVKTQWDTL